MRGADTQRNKRWTPEESPHTHLEQRRRGGKVMVKKKIYAGWRMPLHLRCKMVSFSLENLKKKTLTLSAEFHPKKCCHGFLWLPWECQKASHPQIRRSLRKQLEVSRLVWAELWGIKLRKESLKTLRGGFWRAATQAEGSFFSSNAKQRRFLFPSIVIEIEAMIVSFD